MLCFGFGCAKRTALVRQTHDKHSQPYSQHDVKKNGNTVVPPFPKPKIHATTLPEVGLQYTSIVHPNQICCLALIGAAIVQMDVIRCNANARESNGNGGVQNFKTLGRSCRADVSGHAQQVWAIFHCWVSLVSQACVVRLGAKSTCDNKRDARTFAAQIEHA